MSIIAILGMGNTVVATRLQVIRSLLVITFPTITSLLVTEIILMVIYGKKFKHIPLDHPLIQENIGIPKWIWVIPILVLFILLWPNLIFYLGDIPLFIKDIYSGKYY